MRRSSAGLVALAVALLAGSAAQANIVYLLNQTSTTAEVGGELSPLSDTVSGTITTDGTIGAVQSADILDYDLHLRDNIRPGLSSELTPANSGIWFDTGNSLIATATGLSFDFSHPGAVFIIQGLTHGFSSGFEYFCFQATTGPCLQGETIVPNYYAVDGVLATGLEGVVPLNGVPEPAAWALMLVGFAALGTVKRRYRSTTVAA